MKQIMSIFLLLLAMMVATQPTLAMHFCGGDLESVNFINDVQELCCENTNSSIDSEHTNVLSSRCCDLQQVKVSADEFQIHENTILQNKAEYTIDLVWFAYSFLFNSIDNHLSKDVNLKYPPQGFENLNVDILTSICILRI